MRRERFLDDVLRRVDCWDALLMKNASSKIDHDNARCAYSTNREALAALGARLARLFRDRRSLATITDAIGPRGFDD